jgi:N-acetyl-gamma-glutamyl-phosphate reductase
MMNKRNLYYIRWCFKKKYLISNSHMEGEIFVIWVGIIGAKGYFGGTLSRLVAGHPKAQVSTVMDLQGLYGVGSYISGSNEAKPGYWSMVNAVEKSDVIFNGLSGSIADEVCSKALSCGKRIIDVSGENYMGDCLEGSAGSAYPGSVYGLFALYKDKMRNASIATNPSSYCTGAILGLAPLAANNLVDMDSASIESKSGITSLRRNDKLIETGMTINGSTKTYKIECLKYAKEVNEQLQILFGKGTPTSYASYIIPGIKGITTTIKANPNEGMDISDILDTYRDFYKSNPFVEVCSSGMMPEMKNGLNKYFCKIGASVDADSGKITVTTVLDDAVRGVASQAIQTMNLMCGIDGKVGL